MIQRITIIGLGLIGASLAKSLRKNIPGVHITGVESDPANAAYTLDQKIVDVTAEWEEGVKGQDLIFLALPVDVIAELLPRVLDNIKGTPAMVVDLGSTKARICEAVSAHPARNQFVAAHPIAGTEHSGPQHSFAELFTGKRMILCERKRSSTEAWEKVSRLVHALGMNITELDPDIHDRSYAYVSHLSHAIAYALGVSVLDMEKEIVGLRELSGTGFSSTVRLAKSGSRMWVPVLTQNANETAKAIDAFVAKLEELKKLMIAGDQAGLRSYIEKANEIGKFTDR